MIVAAPRRPALTLSRLGDWGVYIALAVLVILNVVITPHFTALSSIRSLLTDAAPTVVVSLGMALVIATRGIDLSVGAVMALSTASVQLYLGYGSGVSVVVALVASAIAGVVTGILVAAFDINPLIVTLGMEVGVRGLAEVLTNGQLSPVSTSFFATLGSGAVAGIPWAVVSAAVLAVGCGLLVGRTTFGYDLVAIGDNRVASYLSGLRIKRVTLVVYVLSAVLAGIAGLLITGRSQASDPTTLGLLFELDAIAAVVIGGTPLSGGRVTIAGTVAGALLLQLLDATFVANNGSYDAAQVIKAVVIVAAVYIQRRRGS